jgi:predicted lipid carrier protein YhbT
MNLSYATRMILAESVALPDPMRVTRHVHDELSAGRQVPHTALRWILREAGLGGVFNVLTQKYGAGPVRDMILVLEREIDRQALVGSR